MALEVPHIQKGSVKRGLGVGSVLVLHILKMLESGKEKTVSQRGLLSQCSDAQ